MQAIHPVMHRLWVYNQRWLYVHWALVKI
jgi:hypothetical protein